MPFSSWYAVLSSFFPNSTMYFQFPSYFSCPQNAWIWYSELKYLCRSSSLCVTNLLLFVHITRYSNYNASNKAVRATQQFTVRMDVAPSSGQLHKKQHSRLLLFFAVGWYSECGVAYSTERVFFIEAQANNSSCCSKCPCQFHQTFPQSIYLSSWRITIFEECEFWEKKNSIQFPQLQKIKENI